MTRCNVIVATLYSVHVVKNIALVVKIMQETNDDEPEWRPDPK
jgi:hypothetical protein